MNHTIEFVFSSHELHDFVRRAEKYDSDADLARSNFTSEFSPAVLIEFTRNRLSIIHRIRFSNFLSSLRATFVTWRATREKMRKREKEGERKRETAIHDIDE